VTQKTVTLSKSEKQHPGHSILIKLEAYRKKKCTQLRIIFYCCVTTICFCWITSAQKNDFEPAILVSLLGIFTYCMVFSIFYGKYIKRIRKTFLPKFIQGLWPNADYSPYKGITLAEFEVSQIFPYKADNVISENLVEAQVQKTKIRLSSVVATYQPYGAKGSATIFNGLFLIADFNKHTKGRTYVLPDNAERLFGKPGQEAQALSKWHGELVKTEDPEFEKIFVVYSTDQVEARYILSPSLMRNLTEFHKEIKEPIYVSFIDGTMYLGVSNRSLIRNISLSTPLSTNDSTTLFADLISLDKLIEGSLTSRIWTKE